MITRRVIIFMFAFATLAAPIVADAQQPEKVPRIGLLYPGSSSAAAENVAAFGQGLRELGYVEGQSIVIESRYAKVWCR